MAATWQRVKSHAGARLREIDLSENVCKTSVRIYMHFYSRPKGGIFAKRYAWEENLAVSS